MARKHVQRHQRKDRRGEADEKAAKDFEKRQKKLARQIEKASGFIETAKKKEGKRGQEVTSNVTDSESAMTRTPAGYIHQKPVINGLSGNLFTHRNSKKL